MSDDIFQGYKGRALAMLMKFNSRVWAHVKVDTTRGVFEGTILPRAENTDDKHLVLKFFTGYNIGLDVETITDITELGYKKAVYKIPEKEFPYTKGKPNVKLLGTAEPLHLAWITAPEPSFLHSHPVSCTAPFRNWQTSATLRLKNCLLCSVKTWVRTSTRSWLLPLDMRSRRGSTESSSGMERIPCIILLQR